LKTEDDEKHNLGDAIVITSLLGELKTKDKNIRKCLAQLHGVVEGIVHQFGM